MPPLDSHTQEVVSAIVARLKETPGALLPILHGIQDVLGYVPPAAVPAIAEGLNLSRADVHGVISFYHYFRDTKPGRHTIHLCRAEACQSMNQKGLEAHAKLKLGVDFHGTTADGVFTLEPVYCLGNCASSPAMMIDGQLHGRVTPDRFDQIVAGVPHAAAPHVEAVKAPGPAVTVFVPCDAAALSLGAEEVAEAIAEEAKARKIAVTIVRNGTRGMVSLEPLVEVALSNGRVGYGPVAVSDVRSLFDADFLKGGKHALNVGLVEELPFFKKQERLTFKRVGVTDPISLDDYLAHDGYQGLMRALSLSPAEIIQEVTDSGLRGRGGAAFPTGIKWKTVADAPAEQRYVTCNADEGDSGTFADRMLMEGDPFCLIEGMTIASIAVNATQGYIYLRCEYPHAYRALNTAIAAAYAQGYLGENIRGTGKHFDLDVRLGAGAYICGEETSMLESLEGKRGEIRPRPPLPAVKGLFGQPTIVNNVMSLASVPIILQKGGAFYKDFGTGRSRGTLTVQLGGNIKHGGLIEKAFGVTLREILYDFGGGSATGRPIRAVQVGGPLGAYLPESQFDTPLDYEAFANVQALLGHGGIVAFDDTVDMAQMARYAMEFCAIESCGKCTPCRIGSTRGVEVMDRVIAGQNREFHLTLVEELCDTMLNGSLCGLGGLTPYPVTSALRHFRQDFLK